MGPRRLAGYMGGLQIFVNFVTGCTITRALETTDTVDAKSIFLEKGGILPDQHRPMFFGKQLEDGRTPVRLGMRRLGGVQRFVKSLTGKATTLDIKSTGIFIGNVKDRIQDNEAIYEDLVPRLRGEMQSFVRALTGLNITLDVKASHIVHCLSSRSAWPPRLLRHPRDAGPGLHGGQPARS